jgi:hypothetical protein
MADLVAAALLRHVSIRLGKFFKATLSDFKPEIVRPPGKPSSRRFDTFQDPGTRHGQTWD